MIMTLGSSAASGNRYSWYCKRNSSHLPPEIDSQMQFIENYNCHYVDKNAEKENKKIVYLTFDAGYENGNVEKILDILKEENVKGSFFILKNMLTKHSDLVCRMVDEGHLVGNHTSMHKDISKLTFVGLKNELETLEAKFKEKVGKDMPKYFRPPEGSFSEESLKKLDEMGYKTIFWSFAYADWDNNHQMTPEKAKEKILSNIHNGAVILLHPTSNTNVTILSSVIRELKSQGYSFETVANL